MFFDRYECWEVVIKNFRIIYMCSPKLCNALLTQCFRLYLGHTLFFGLETKSGKGNVKVIAFYCTTGSDVKKTNNQARRQDLAAGGPKTRKRDQKLEGGAHF